MINGRATTLNFFFYIDKIKCKERKRKTIEKK